MKAQQNLFGNEKTPKRKRHTPQAPKDAVLYFPSNGTDGAIFEANNCNKCTKEKNCTILIGAYNNTKEPKQWIKEKEKEARCISLKAKQ